MKVDGEGRLWVGTNGAGLLRLNRREVRVFGAPSGLGEITAVVSDGAGGAFATSGCRGLFHLDATGISTPIPLRDPTAAQDVADGGCGISLASGRDGSVWARSRLRLYHVQRRPLRVRRLRGDLPDEEGPVALTPTGELWVVSRSGVARLLSPTGTSLRELVLPAPLMSATVAPDGALWVGGDGRVSRVKGDVVHHYGPDVQTPRGLVRDIAVGADGSAWIGTYGGGLGLLRNGRVTRVSAAHGLPDNAVSRILDDGRGRLWVSTNRGLAVIARGDLEAVADGRRLALAPVVIGPERGVAEANFGSPAGFADASGRLWVGTIEGVATLDAAAFPFVRTPPVVRIESLAAGDRRLDLADTVPVPPLTERIRVEFSSFGLLHPERALFRFMVEGSGGEWVTVGHQPVLDWTPPGPGLQRLLIEARNEDGIWSSAPAAVLLDVRPAWWQTLAFRVGAAAVAVFAIVAAFRTRVRRIERRHADRLRGLEEQRQAEEREAGLRAQLEHVSRVALAGELAASLAHEVRQPIGAIVNNAEAGKRNLSHYLQRPADLEAILSDIVADGMRASEVVRGLRGFLRPRGEQAAAVDLSALVREMLPLVRRELQDNHVEVALTLAERLPPVDGFRVQLGQVVVNLVMNACEALAGTAGDRRVAISAAVAEHVFDPFVTTKPDGLGMGLAICRSIAEAHGGRLSADAPPGGGLRMTLSLPASSGVSRT
jgi:signal transduction histidine kinase/streptogramin lyase